MGASFPLSSLSLLSVFCCKREERRFHEGKDHLIQHCILSDYWEKKMPQVFLTNFMSEDLGINILISIIGLLRHIRLLLHSFILFGERP